jgi:hypothetical protein
LATDFCGKSVKLLNLLITTRRKVARREEVGTWNPAVGLAAYLTD